MLVLTRKLGEKVIIGKDIEVKLLAIRGNQASLGVEAPKDLAIHRADNKNAKKTTK